MRGSVVRQVSMESIWHTLSKQLVGLSSVDWHPETGFKGSKTKITDLNQIIYFQLYQTIETAIFIPFWKWMWHHHPCHVSTMFAHIFSSEVNVHALSNLTYHKIDSDFTSVFKVWPSLLQTAYGPNLCSGIVNCHVAVWGNVVLIQNWWVEIILNITLLYQIKAMCYQLFCHLIDIMAQVHVSTLLIARLLHCIRLLYF